MIARNPASGSLAAVLVVARLRVSLRSRTETDARFASSAIGSNRDRTSATDVNLPFCASNESPQRKSAEDRDPFLPAIPTFPFDSPPIAPFLPFLFSSSSPDSSPPEHARNGRFLLFDPRVIFLFLHFLPSSGQRWNVGSSLAVEISNSRVRRSRHPRLGKVDVAHKYITRCLVSSVINSSGLSSFTPINSLR